MHDEEVLMWLAVENKFKKKKKKNLGKHRWASINTARIKRFDRAHVTNESALVH